MRKLFIIFTIILFVAMSASVSAHPHRHSQNYDRYDYDRYDHKTHYDRYDYRQHHYQPRVVHVYRHHQPIIIHDSHPYHSRYHQTQYRRYTW